MVGWLTADILAGWLPGCLTKCLLPLYKLGPDGSSDHAGLIVGKGFCGSGKRVCCNFSSSDRLGGYWLAGDSESERNQGTTNFWVSFHICFRNLPGLDDVHL